jgi:hypothetical protein
MTTRTLVAACATLAALTAPSVATAADAQTSALKFKQPTCGKFKKQVKKTSGDKKRAAKYRLKQCKADMLVYKQVRNQRFVGIRADGIDVDIQYCANGKWQDDVADGGRVGTSGWRVVDAKVKRGGKRFSAVVEAWIPGGIRVQGVIRNGDHWQVGYEFGGEVKSPGDAERTDARAACAAL